MRLVNVCPYWVVSINLMRRLIDIHYWLKDSSDFEVYIGLLGWECKGQNLNALFNLPFVDGEIILFFCELALLFRLSFCLFMP